MGAESFGYRNVQDAIYDKYYTKGAFFEFIEKMRQNDSQIYSKFKEGKGSELCAKRNGIIPPKMASVASSSRFCYLALRKGVPHLNIDLPINVEHECLIIGKRGTQPQLDAFAENSNTYIKVKCHEIFHTKKETKLGSFYIEYIYGTKDNIGFNLPIEQKPTGQFEIPFEQFGMESFPIHLDLKQFLCHLLGVAS